MNSYHALGAWLQQKVRDRLADCGGDTQAVARQLRKQGYPIEVARFLLLSKQEDR